MSVINTKKSANYTSLLQKNKKQNQGHFEIIFTL